MLCSEPLERREARDRPAHEIASRPVRLRPAPGAACATSPSFPEAVIQRAEDGPYAFGRDPSLALTRAMSRGIVFFASVVDRSPEGRSPFAGGTGVSPVRGFITPFLAMKGERGIVERAVGAATVAVPR